MRKNIYIGLALFASIIMISGVTYLAVATPGSQADPFISLSYLTDVFRPQVMSELEDAEQRVIQDINARITLLERQMQGTQAGTTPVSPGNAATFSVVTLSRDQTLTASVGTEIMLRIGTATGRGTAPALVNYTTGTALSAGSALTENHMYLVTIEGNGITATADVVRVLVRGSFTIA